MRALIFVGSVGKRIVMMITNGTITVIIIISIKGTRHFAMGTNKDIYWSPFPGMALGPKPISLRVRGK